MWSVFPASNQKIKISKIFLREKNLYKINAVLSLSLSPEQKNSSDSKTIWF